MTAIQRGLTWLSATQAPTGELASHAGPTDTSVQEWARDDLNFVTALGALALAEVEDPLARTVVARAAALLWQERLGSGLWRYWSIASPQAHDTPPDADDTACASLAVALIGRRTSKNVAVLDHARSPDGRYYAWLLPTPRPASMAVRWALRSERRTETRALRARLWATTEAEPDDIDAVVNANVCRYLGDAAAPDAVAWVADVVRSGSGSGDKWHRSRWSLLAAVSDGARRGIAAFADLAPLMAEEACAAAEDADALSSYEAALALRVACEVSAPATTADRLERRLHDAQGPDGAWPRDLCYHGGPKELFAWASEALTTAAAIGALHASLQRQVQQ